MLIYKLQIPPEEIVHSLKKKKKIILETKYNIMIISKKINKIYHYKF